MRGIPVIAVTVVLAGLALPASAHADRMYGITAATPPHVVSFDSEHPATFVDNQTITGLGGVTVVGGVEPGYAGAPVRASAAALVASPRMPSSL